MPSNPVVQPKPVGTRTVIAVFLLLLTVPWWPGLEGQVAGIPAWAVFSLVASCIYALVVAWLLERHWDDGGGEMDTSGSGQD